MTVCREEYNGVVFHISSQEILVRNAQGQQVGGQYYGSFRLGVEPPSFVSDGEWIKEIVNGVLRVRLFSTEQQALEAAAIEARKRIDSATGSMV